MDSLNQVEVKTLIQNQELWSFGGRSSKDGTEKKPGQKLKFTADCTEGRVTDLPADLNKISVVVPPGTARIITLHMTNGFPSKSIRFDNSDPVKEITGRIYLDPDTGDICLVKDTSINAKIEGPAENKFGTRRRIEPMPKDTLDITQELSTHQIPKSEPRRLGKKCRLPQEYLDSMSDLEKSRLLSDEEANHAKQEEARRKYLEEEQYHMRQHYLREAEETARENAS